MLCMLSLYFNALPSVWHYLWNMCGLLFSLCVLVALFVNVQYFSVFNISAGVQMSLVDRRLNKLMNCRSFWVKLEYE